MKTYSINLHDKPFLLILIVISVLFCFTTKENQGQTQEEKEFKVWQIPNIEEGAEFYFSPDGKSMIGNAKFGDDTVHQVYTFNIDGTEILKINDKGEDACSFYFPDGKKLLFTSTRDNLDMPKGSFSDPNDYPQGAEIYSCDLKGCDVNRLTDNNYYDAEISVSPDGEWLLFTRQIDGKCVRMAANSNRLLLLQNGKKADLFLLITKLLFVGHGTLKIKGSVECQ